MKRRHPLYRRAITEQEHLKIVASEKNSEKRAYYQFLWETGAAPGDAAELDASCADLQNETLTIHRKKLGPGSVPARLKISSHLRKVLEDLPRFGPLFPTIASATPSMRSAEFRRRCRIDGIEGLSIHSYRAGWIKKRLES